MTGMNRTAVADSAIQISTPRKMDNPEQVVTETPCPGCWGEQLSPPDTTGSSLKPILDMADIITGENH